MARVTVEDCQEKIPNRFELVLVASHRAKQIIDSGTAKIEAEGSKPDIIALREIAAGVTDKKVLEEPIMSEMTKDRSLLDLMHSKFMELPTYDEDDEFGDTVDGDDDENWEDLDSILEDNSSASSEDEER